MLPSRRLDARLIRRLTTRIASAVKSLGPGEYPVFNLADVSGEVYLPEVHLLSEGASEWLLPRIKFTTETLIMSYELFVEQALGTTDRPGKVVETFLGESGVTGSAHVFDVSRDPRRWFTPALRLLAYASQMKGAVVTVDRQTSTFAVDVDGVIFKVSPQGAWSNSQGETMLAKTEPKDLESAQMLFPSRTSTSKVLVALDSMLTDPRRDFGPHLRVLAELFEARLLSPNHFVATLTKPATPESAEEQARRRKAAAEQAQQVLSAAERNVIRALYVAVVPDLYSSREFVRAFGSTSSMNSDRKLRSRTRVEWAEQIRIRAEHPA